MVSIVYSIFSFLLRKLVCEVIRGEVNVRGGEASAGNPWVIGVALIACMGDRLLMKLNTIES